MTALHLFFFLLLLHLLVSSWTVHAWVIARGGGQAGSCQNSATSEIWTAASKPSLDDVFGPPYVALVTERSACESDDHIDKTVKSIHAAVKTGQVALVSVRVSAGDCDDSVVEDRVIELTRRLLALAVEYHFLVVVSSEWIDAAVKADAHGVHVKETHRPLIAEIRKKFDDVVGRHPVIGMSAHSIESALEAWSTYAPDYFVVGTCYETPSHPEKAPEDLEGPALPGQVAAALSEQTGQRPPVIAIGGIDASNCHEPVIKYGADGIATIRAVLHAKEPASVVRAITTNMSN